MMRGMLISFSDPNIGLVPTLVPFQYNPAEVTRTIKVNRSGGLESPGLRVQDTPTESYTLKIELDGVDAVDKPITGVMGVQPLLATIEAMLEPAGSLGVLGAVGSALAGAVSALTGGGHRQADRLLGAGIAGPPGQRGLDARADQAGMRGGVDMHIEPVDGVHGRFA